MIDDILKAICAETVAFCASIADDNIGTPQVMLVTDFKEESMTSYSMPLVLIYCTDDFDLSQWIGGAKRVGWGFCFGSYHYAPDANLDDTTGYPPSLLIVIDKITDHFSAGLVNALWLTQGMTDIFNEYCFQTCLAGMQRADPLNRDGLIMGWKTIFETISIGPATLSIRPSTAVLTYIVQTF